MLSIGNKKYRNLQEQVGYNTECIQKLAEAIDGITLEDKLVIIANDSGTFTDEEMTVLNGPLAFISDGSKVWLKQSETASEFVFKAIDIVATEQGGTHYNVGGSKIVVTIATRAYITADDVIITTYDKTQMDALLSTKASLSGANFTGPITATSIIEDMSSGYNFTPQTSTKGTIEYVYVGAVKNGNKLTLVCAYNFTKNEGATGSLVAGRFYLPAGVMSKIFPSIGTNAVDIKRGIALPNTYSSIDILLNITKYDNVSIYCNVSEVSALTAGVSYYIRHEVTILLSDNLAQ